MKKTEHRYEIILYWSNEDDAYIAEVPKLPGCAADGGSYQEAIANVEVLAMLDRTGSAHEPIALTG